MAGVPVEFILFALTLLGVALFHHNTLQVALSGLVVISLYKLFFTGFKFGEIKQAAKHFMRFGFNAAFAVKKINRAAQFFRRR